MYQKVVSWTMADYSEIVDERKLERQTIVRILCLSLLGNTGGPDMCRQ